MVERISTGVEGLDVLLRGGIPRKSVIEICGTPGAGKSTLGMQFLLNGVKHGERGLYVAMEQSKDDIIASFSGFNWNLEKYVDSGDIFIMWAEQLPRSDAITSNVLNAARIMNVIKGRNIRRVVLDSLNVFRLMLSLIHI